MSMSFNPLNNIKNVFIGVKTLHKEAHETNACYIYESPEGTWGFSKKAMSKSLYRIVQSVLTD